jgi:hypothetical protein
VEELGKAAIREKEKMEKLEQERIAREKRIKKQEREKDSLKRKLWE